tara:strand:+ start:2922 stop:4478 length:1557 start_codon:yes stop_codon:yes gene_type:complete
MKKVFTLLIISIIFSCSSNLEQSSVKDITVTSSSEEAESLFREFLYLSEEQNGPDSQESLRKALRLDANFHLAKAYSNLNQPSNIISAFNERENVSEMEQYIIEAWYYIENQEFDRAYGSVSKLTETFPDISRAWSISARIKTLTGDLYESIDDSKKALELDPNNFGSYLNLLTKHIIVGNGEGLLPPEERDIDEATKIIEKMRSIRPNAPFSYMLSGNFARNQNRLEEAFEYYKQSKDVNKSGSSQLFQSNHYMALTNTFLGKYDEAEKLFRENIAISDEGSFWKSYQMLFLAKMNTFRNDFDKAIQVLDELEKNLPNFGYSQRQTLGSLRDIQISRFLNFAHSQQDEEAINAIEVLKEVLNEIIDLDKVNFSKSEYDKRVRDNDRDILILETWNDILFGRYEDAREKLIYVKTYAEEDLSSNPRSFHDYFAFLGMVNLNEGNFKEALTNFEKTDNTVTAGLYINRVCGTYFEYFYSLALKGNGDEDKANQILQRLSTTNFYGYDNALVRSLAASQI